MKNNTVLDSDKIGSLLLKLTIPSFLGMAVTTLYNVVDTIFIGQYVGSLGIAGLSIVFPIQMLSLGIGMMTGMGGASLISRLFGAGQKDKAEHALGNALFGSFLLSLIIMIAVSANLDLWLKLMGASPEILPYAHDYLQILIFGLFFQTLAMTFNSLLVAEGNARITMIGQIIGSVSNIILDVIFIIIMGMGVQGAALGTIVAQFLAVSFFLFFYFSGRSHLEIRVKNFIFNFGIVKSILAIGVSGMAMTLASSISTIFINRILVSLGNDIAISSYGIINRIMMFAIMPGISIGQGVQPIIGFNYGMKRYDRVIKAIKTAAISASVLCSIVFLLLYSLPALIVSVFTSDQELISSAVHASRFIFSTVALTGSVMVGSVTFQALGKAKEAFVTSITRPALFLLPLVLLLSHFLKLNGVWLAFPLTDFFTFIVVALLIVPQMRELKKMGTAAISPASLQSNAGLR